MFDSNGVFIAESKDLLEKLFGIPVSFEDVYDVIKEMIVPLHVIYSAPA